MHKPKPEGAVKPPPPPPPPPRRLGTVRLEVEGSPVIVAALSSARDGLLSADEASALIRAAVRRTLEVG